MTDKDKLTERFKHIIDNHACGSWFDDLEKKAIVDICMAVYDLAKEEAAWISVDDRLPEIVSELGSECVLVYTNKGMVMAASFVNIGDRFQWEYTNPFMIAQNITHWRPLPSPPPINQTTK